MLALFCFHEGVLKAFFFLFRSHDLNSSLMIWIPFHDMKIPVVIPIVEWTGIYFGFVSTISSETGVVWESLSMKWRWQDEQDTKVLGFFLSVGISGHQKSLLELLILLPVDKGWSCEMLLALLAPHWHVHFTHVLTPNPKFC